MTYFTIDAYEQRGSLSNTVSVKRPGRNRAVR